MRADWSRKFEKPILSKRHSFCVPNSIMLEKSFAPAKLVTAVADFLNSGTPTAQIGATVTGKRLTADGRGASGGVRHIASAGIQK